MADTRVDNAPGTEGAYTAVRGSEEIGFERGSVGATDPRGVRGWRPPGGLRSAWRRRTILLALLAVTSAPVAAQEPAATVAAGMRQGDAGEWTDAVREFREIVEREPDNGVARYRLEIERRRRACALLKHRTAAGGRRGKSLNVYERQTELWRPLRVTDRGNVMDYSTGRMRSGAMHCEGTNLTLQGDIVLRRMIVTPVAPDTVRQEILQARDEGQTWSSVWTGINVRRGDDADAETERPNSTRGPAGATNP